MDHITTSFGIPIYAYDEGVELPTEGAYYIVAANGLFSHRDNGLTQVTTPVKGIGILRDFVSSSRVGHNFGKIPGALIGKIKLFFEKVVAKLHSEACIILHYNRETKDYIIQVPMQRVCHAGVWYERTGNAHQIPGYLPVGTIHSHCDFQAFHSGTDEHDEETWDGLHITFGHNDCDNFTIAASVVMSGIRTQIDPLTVIDGVEFGTTSIAGSVPHLDLSPRYSLTNQIDKADPEVEQWLDQVRPA